VAHVFYVTDRTASLSHVDGYCGKRCAGVAVSSGGAESAGGGPRLDEGCRALQFWTHDPRGLKQCITSIEKKWQESFASAGYGKFVFRLNVTIVGIAWNCS
jgi:hypothetical protein